MDDGAPGLLLRHASRHRGLLAGWWLSIVVSTVLSVLLPVLIGRAFDSVWQHGRSALLPLTALLLGSQLARALVSAARIGAAATLASEIEFGIRRDAYASVAARSARWHSVNPSGEILSRLLNDARSTRALVYPAGDVLLSSWGFIAIDLIVAPWYHWSLILAPLGYAVGYVLVSRRFVPRLLGATNELRARFGALNSEAEETLNGLEAMRLSGLTGVRLRRLLGRAEAVGAAYADQARVEARNPLFLLLGAVQAVGFGQALLLALAGRLTPGEVVAYVGLLLMLGLPTFSALAGYPLAAEGVSALSRLRAMMLDPAEDPSPHGHHRRPVRGLVELVDVTFGYRPDRPVLRGVSLTVAPGALVAVVGAAGSGKSTLTRLLVGSYAPDRGRVVIDGVDLPDWDREALRAQVAIVPQETAVFRDTVAGNVAMGRRIDRGTLRAALTAAAADAFVDQLPDGVDTRLGPPDGLALSGGERQRIAIARALAGRPRVLILDDSTSALDSDTEQRVWRGVLAQAAGASLVVVTSRPSLAQLADVAVVLRAGAVVATGSPERLARHADEYVRLCVTPVDTALSHPLLE